MKKVVFSLFSALLIVLTLISCQKETKAPVSPQDELQFSLGCLLLPSAEYEAIPLAPAPKSDLKAFPVSVTLPSPTVGNQGGEGSCVAWGTTYAGRSMDWYFTYANTTYSFAVNVFSPEYVYNQIKVSTCASGSYVTAGLNLLKSQGVCTWNSMPYTDKDCSTMPDAAQRTEASGYKITSYGRISITESSIKTYLAANKPVIVAGPVNRSFVNLGNNQVLGKYTGTTLGGHCYCLVGYDNTKNAFKFQNSWGTDWASQGFGWISYKYIKSWWNEAYVVSTAVLP
jgi:C1A family cysteine protease